MTLAESVYAIFAIVIVFLYVVYALAEWRIDMNTKQLRSMSARVITTTYDGCLMFILKSYRSLVAAYIPDYDLVLLAELWQCSTTTKKHVRAFLKDYADMDVSVVTIREHMPAMFNTDSAMHVMLCGARKVLLMYASADQLRYMMYS